MPPRRRRPAAGRSVVRRVAEKRGDRARVRTRGATMPRLSSIAMFAAAAVFARASAVQATIADDTGCTSYADTDFQCPSAYLLRRVLLVRFY